MKAPKTPHQQWEADLREDYARASGQPTGGAESAPEAQAVAASSQPVPFAPWGWHCKSELSECIAMNEQKPRDGETITPLYPFGAELLEALQEAVACNRNAHPEPYWMQAARAAISKATQPA